MSASREIELGKNYEEILERRAEFLSDMQSRYLQNNKMDQQSVDLQHATERNRRLLEDVRKTEELLSQSQMIDPDILSLETQYWVSVEEQIPAWQSSLLGPAPAPVDPGLGRPPRKARQRPAVAKDPSRPPLPRPRGPL